MTNPHVQNVRIRDANAADLPGLRALFLRARRETFVWLPSRDFELTDFDEQTRGELLLLAVDGTGRLLGFVSVQEPTDFIHHLFVRQTTNDLESAPLCWKHYRVGHSGAISSNACAATSGLWPSIAPVASRKSAQAVTRTATIYCSNGAANHEHEPRLARLPAVERAEHPSAKCLRYRGSVSA